MILVDNLGCVDNLRYFLLIICDKLKWVLLVDNLGYFDNLGSFWLIIWVLLVAYLGCENGRKSHRLSFTQPGGRFGRRQAHVDDPDEEAGPSC